MKIIWTVNSDKRKRYSTSQSSTLEIVEVYERYLPTLTFFLFNWLIQIKLWKFTHQLIKDETFSSNYSVEKIKKNPPKTQRIKVNRKIIKSFLRHFPQLWYFFIQLTISNWVLKFYTQIKVRFSYYLELLSEEASRIVKDATWQSSRLERLPAVHCQLWSFSFE